MTLSSILSDIVLFFFQMKSLVHVDAHAMFYPDTMYLGLYILKVVRNL